ncbi:PPE domain-containing protein [Mycobacterium simiae]|uniref:PPE domain-containing protein n=1 Tax=Mycobacterium simiae TaxID=1784 RepID=A0A5B1BLC8_MYCSI|nr:PPE domain-containing protein [Mycobacterium simiae]KAA1249196.1 PPE domain-containing protein [Mycobacterium simiae]
MTTLICLALTPQIHRALANAGPGPGSVLAPPAAWTSLSTEYIPAPRELTETIALPDVAWKGTSTEWHVTAHQPHLGSSRPAPIVSQPPLSIDAGEGLGQRASSNADVFQVGR